MKVKLYEFLKKVKTGEHIGNFTIDEDDYIYHVDRRDVENIDKKYLTEKLCSKFELYILGRKYKLNISEKRRKNLTKKDIEKMDDSETNMKRLSLDIYVEPYTGIFG